MKKTLNITEGHHYIEDDIQNMLKYIVDFVKITTMMLISDTKELILENLYSQGYKPGITYNKPKRKGNRA